MLSETQLEMHNKSITGSKVASILGLSTFKSKWQLFCEMHGDIEVEQKDSVRMRIGGYAENTIDRICIEELKWTVITRNINGQYHPQYPFLWGLIDRIRIDSSPKRILEYKNIDKMFQKDWEEQIPEQYLCQLYFYMSLYDCPGTFVVLFGGNDFKVYDLEPNKQIQDFIINECIKFWEDLQNHKYPNEPDSSISCTNTLRKLYPNVRGGMQDGIPEMLEIAKEYENINRQIKLLEENKTLLGNQLRLAIGDSEGLNFGIDGYVNNKMTCPKTMKFDEKRFVEENPEQAKFYYYLPQGYRTLRVQVKK